MPVAVLGEIQHQPAGDLEGASILYPIQSPDLRRQPQPEVIQAQVSGKVPGQLIAEASFSRGIHGRSPDCTEIEV